MIILLHIYKNIIRLKLTPRFQKTHGTACCEKLNFELKCPLRCLSVQAPQGGIMNPSEAEVLIKHWTFQSWDVSSDVLRYNYRYLRLK